MRVEGNDGELRPWHYIYEGRRGRWGNSFPVLSCVSVSVSVSVNASKGNPKSCPGAQLHPELDPPGYQVIFGGPVTKNWLEFPEELPYATLQYPYEQPYVPADCLPKV